MAGLAAGLALGVQADTTLAQSFLTGKSKGMTECVRAIFSNKEVKKVNVHGHHFNCKPLIRSNPRDRTIHISHAQVGLDDQVFVTFTVNSLGVMLPNSAEAIIGQGISINSIVKVPKKRPVKPSSWVGRYVSHTYATVANKAQRIAPKKTKDWQEAAGQIAAVVIAELGKPKIARIPASMVNCAEPTFYVDENFRGKSFTLNASQANLGKVAVGDTRMINKISSMCVPRGWVVTAHKKVDFKGGSQTFTGHVAHDDLHRVRQPNGRYVNWNNRIGSIQVRRDVSSQKTPVKILRQQ